MQKYGFSLKRCRLFPIFYKFVFEFNLIYMKYQKAEFTINCKNEDKPIVIDLVISIAGEAGFESFEDHPDKVVGYVQPHLLNTEMLTSELQNFPISDVEISYELQSIADINWNLAWEEIGFEPVYINKQCVVYDAKHTSQSQLIENIPIKVGIETQQAFGTGTHPTTQMMIKQILQLNLKRKTILDCGCGTGVLGIVAAQKGAKSIVSYDIDEWSVKNTQHNARINHINNIKVFQSDSSILNGIKKQFDLILANINRNILLHDIATFASVMKDDGTLILSGFYKEDSLHLLEKAENLVLKETACDSQDQWACIVFKKKRTEKRL